MAENKHRWKIQLGAALASNPFLMNFLHGRISRTGLKAVCVPGLNCYSCPAAAASCPIGALQAVIGSSKFQFAWYVVGFLIFAGALLGRVVCGFLCPFGWFQELLHKIPAKKFSTRRVRILTYLKYGILALFVIVLPMTVVNEVGMGDPFFCKYICPAGILEGGIPLALADAGIRAGLGGLFTWKSCILLGTALLAVFFYRPFCKWLCPLGAFRLSAYWKSMLVKVWTFFLCCLHSDVAIIVMVCKSLHLHASTEILIAFGQEQSSASL